MTEEEMKIAKFHCQTAILKAINEFEKETGLTIVEPILYWKQNLNGWLYKRNIEFETVEFEAKDESTGY